jgi:hypothetical protein
MRCERRVTGCGFKPSIRDLPRPLRQYCNRENFTQICPTGERDGVVIRESVIPNACEES